MAHYETSAIVEQVRIYDDAGKYKSSFILLRDGDRGNIQGLNGEHFYKYFAPQFDTFMKSQKLKYVEAYVLTAFVQPMVDACMGLGKFSIQGMGMKAERPMTWVRIEPIE